jgi:hypothetical protein
MYITWLLADKVQNLTKSFYWHEKKM